MWLDKGWNRRWHDHKIEVFYRKVVYIKSPSTPSNLSGLNGSKHRELHWSRQKGLAFSPSIKVLFLSQSTVSENLKIIRERLHCLLPPNLWYLPSFYFPFLYFIVTYYSLHFTMAYNLYYLIHCILFPFKFIILLLFICQCVICSLGLW